MGRRFTDNVVALRRPDSVAEAVRLAEQAFAILDGLDLTAMRRQVAEERQAAAFAKLRNTAELFRSERTLAAAEYFAGAMGRLRRDRP